MRWTDEELAKCFSTAELIKIRDGLKALAAALLANADPGDFAAGKELFQIDRLRERLTRLIGDHDDG